MPSRIEAVHELEDGDIVIFPMEHQSQPHMLIVDTDIPQREGAVPLRGEKGGAHKLKQTDKFTHLNFWSPIQDEWISQGTCSIEQLRVIPPDEAHPSISGKLEEGEYTSTPPSTKGFSTPRLPNNFVEGVELLLIGGVLLGSPILLFYTHSLIAGKLGELWIPAKFIWTIIAYYIFPSTATLMMFGILGVLAIIVEVRKWISPLITRFWYR